MMLRILHLDDDEIVLMAVARMVRTKGLPYEIDMASSVTEAVRLLDERSYDIAMLDYMLPDGNGLEVLEKTREKGIPAIFITGSGEVSLAVKALQSGAYDYIVKDYASEFLKLVQSTIDKVMHQYLLEVEHKKTAEQLTIVNAELSKLYEETLTLSLHDALTGLANRRLMETELERDIARAKRSGEPLSALMIDVDHFKRYNDTHGHSAGDRLLQVIAKTISEEIRATDLAARYGGEEFTVILPDTSLKNALGVADRIRSAVEMGTGVSVSIGVASFQSDMDALKFLDKADEALYRAKQNGRNRVEG